MKRFRTILGNDSLVDPGWYVRLKSYFGDEGYSCSETKGVCDELVVEWKKASTEFETFGFGSSVYRSPNG